MTKHEHGLKKKVEGAIDKVKGEVKEAVGKVTDNKKLQAEGKWDKVKGTAKDTVGNVKEKVHEYKEHNNKNTLDEFSSNVFFILLYIMNQMTYDIFLFLYALCKRFFKGISIPYNKTIREIIKNATRHIPR